MTASVRITSRQHLRSSPARVCGYPGCPVLTTEPYCPNHRTKGHAVGARFPHNIYATRRWRGIRRARLRLDPYCSCDTDCCPDGCFRFANVVDHIIGLAEGGLPYDLDNTQSMAADCHNRKTARGVKR